MTSIYALTDPRDGRVRYIGKTRQTLEKRLKQHLHPNKIKAVCLRANWIKRLKTEGLTPSIVLLVLVPDERANEYEKLFIAQYRKLGYDLTNQTDGGDGRVYPKGTKFSEEHRRKMSKAKRGKPRPDLAERNRKGLSNKTRAKISKARRGKPLSRAHKEKVINVLKKWRANNPAAVSERAKRTAAKRRRDPITGVFSSKSGKANLRSEYICPVCGESFDRSQVYAGHMRKHAPTSDEERRRRSERMKRRWAEDREHIISLIHGSG